MPRLVLRPLQTFLETEYGGGLILLVAAVAAVVWANLSPEGYEHLWDTTLSLRFGRWNVSHQLRYWINDGLIPFSSSWSASKSSVSSSLAN